MFPGLSWSGGIDDPKIRSLASWYFASRSAKVWGTGEGEAEEVFEGVVVDVGRLSILIGAWMIVGGGGETIAVEVDDLEITSCGMGDFVFLAQYLSQLSMISILEEGVGRSRAAYAVSQIF